MAEFGVMEDTLPPSPLATGAATSARVVLTAEQFQQLADVPSAVTWFANIANPQTRRAYQSDLTEFMTFTGITDPDQFRSVKRTFTGLA